MALDFRIVAATKIGPSWLPGMRNVAAAFVVEMGEGHSYFCGRISSSLLRDDAELFP